MRLVTRKSQCADVHFGFPATTDRSSTLPHRVITRRNASEIFLVILKQFRALEIFGKGGLLQGITLEISKLAKAISLAPFS